MSQTHSIIKADKFQLNNKDIIINPELIKLANENDISLALHFPVCKSP